jgi:hypothetical protein
MIHGPKTDGSGPVLTFHFEGKVITTQADAAHYSYDDS